MKHALQRVWTTFAAFREFQFSSVQSLSCIWLCDSMNCSMPGRPILTNSQSLLKLMSIESVRPSNHLILCRPLLLLPSIFPSIRVFSNESALHMRWLLCPMSESLSGKREGFQDNATRKKREVYCWLESGLLLRIQNSGTGSESAEPKLLPNL